MASDLQMQQLQITHAVLEARINRALAKQGLKMEHNPPGSDQNIKHGGYVVVSSSTGKVMEQRVVLCSLARRLNILEGFELELID